MKLGKDKILHISTCAGIALFVAIIAGVLNAPVIVAALCGYLCALGTGLGKEYGDKVNPYNKWDWYDVLADICGSLLGALLGTIILILI